MILPSTDASISRAVDALRAGECIGLPTETVYGLAADGLNAAAVARIFSIKQRPTFDPLILHVAEPGDLALVASSLPPVAGKLMGHFWPGPLTVVVPKSKCVPDLVTSGLDTVAVRCPSHPVATKVLRLFGGPLAAPSANPFGRLSPTTARAVESELGAALALVLDGGACQRGIESTIIDCSGDHPVLLRHGAIPREEIEAVIGRLGVSTDGETLKSPGMLAHHYAPRTPLWLASVHLRDHSGFAPDTGLLVWHHAPDHPGKVLVLTPNNDPVEAASRLFELLREMDDSGLRRIVVDIVPGGGLGRAIQDRLSKASSGTLRREGNQWREIPRMD